MASARRSSNHGGEGEVHIVVDLSNQLSPNGRGTHRESSDANRRNGSRNRVLGIDLNGPAMQEFEAEYPDTPAPSPVADAPVQDFSDSNFESTFDGYIDWGRGSIDVAPDGRLAYYESAPAPVAEDDNNDDNDDDNNNNGGGGYNNGGGGFDLKAAVQEARDKDEAYYEGRLENLRNGGGYQVDDKDLDLDIKSPLVEDPYVPLWFH